MKLKKLHWVSLLIVFFLLSGGLIHLIFSGNAIPEQPLYSMASELETPHNIQQGNPQQLTALTMKLAELQSQVLRINALGERLAEASNIPEKEFNFNELPPSGGPSVEYEDITAKSIKELSKDISSLEDLMFYEEKQLNMLESLMLGHHIESMSYLSGRPIRKGWLSSYFGTRKDPFSGRPATHKGVDFAGKENADIIATAAGVVSWAGERSGYGHLIELDHGQGIKTRYGHNKVLLVSAGDVVTKGQVIARMGSTGRSTGPHVHYEILRNNQQINPIKFIYRKAK
ncbi:M23 family metallopeptidase [Pseudocolwellia agarivorans]|uniref:M23 family metallopeptidase n=1 Tax=Pseudocolwellia agarivorans TaxID=1911682 RepID=UPI001FE33ECC|nr:M23 family metallopeptidase [Pseudocolwellia agarivorans]